MKNSPKHRLLLRINYYAFIALFLSVIACLAWLSTQYVVHSDWSAGNRNSLTQDSMDLLDTLDGVISIRSYLSDEINIQTAAQEIFSRYQLHKPALDFQLLNPDLDIESAKQDAITSYGQTVIIYNNKQEIINNLSEQSIANALIRLSRDSKPVLFFLQGHGERNPVATSAIGYSELANKLQNNGFSLRALNLLRDAINPQDGLLIIAGASDPILEGEAAQITDYIEQGGNLLWLQDPHMPVSFETIKESLGIDFMDGVVVDTDPQLREVLRLSHPAKLPVISYKLHAITEKMQNFTLFFTASALDIKQSEHWLASPLLLSQKTSWSETQGFTLDVEYQADKGDIQGPLIIGAALERSRNKADNAVQRIVIIGDSDFLANNNLGHGANLEFTLNTFNWLSKSDQLISIKVPRVDDFKLELSSTAIILIGFGFLLILPAGLLLSGLLIWLNRRKK